LRAAYELASPQFLPVRSRRARAFRHFRRTLCRRNADAVDLDLEKAYADAKADPAFQKEMNGYLKDYVGRPSPLYFAQRLTEHLGGAKIYFKREELNHTGSHKVNNVLGQIMVARRMGKKRIIAETGAGQHGVATATLCARFGLECIVYMGAVDVERQQPNVIRMEMLGAKVVPVQVGAAHSRMR
jgi:tryptophan synthase beta chain